MFVREFYTRRKKCRQCTVVKFITKVKNVIGSCVNDSRISQLMLTETWVVDKFPLFVSSK